MTELSKDKLAYLWVEHSNKMWRTVYATPIVSVPVIAGWFALHSEGEATFAFLTAFLGMLLMIVQWAIITRMAQFDGAFLSILEAALPDFGAPILRLNGKLLAQSVPLILLLIFFLLAIVSFTFPFVETGGGS